MSNKVEVVVGLSDEDRKLLKSTSALITKALAAVGGKASAPSKPAKGKAAEADEDFDDGVGDDDGEGDEDGDGDGEDDDGLDDDDDEGDGDEGPSGDDVASALKAYASATNKALAVKLLKTVGGGDGKLSSLKPAKYQAVIDAANKATKAAKAKAAKAK